MKTKSKIGRLIQKP